MIVKTDKIHYDEACGRA